MEKIRITIIEDNHCTSKMLVKILSGVKEFVVCAVFTYAEEAIDSMNNFTSDIIISDFRLSTELNGFHAAEKIRELINTPIIFYSSILCNESIEQCLSLKNTSFLPKTTPISELIDKVFEMAQDNLTFSHQ